MIPVLDVVSLLCLVIIFVTSCQNMTVDPSKTFNLKIVEQLKTKINIKGNVIQQHGTKKIRDGVRDMTDTEKRRRFMWYAILSMPPIVTAIVHLIQ